MRPLHPGSSQGGRTGVASLSPRERSRTGPASSDLFERLAGQHGRSLHLHYDPATRLRAVIAIHSTKLGPAVGGCRCVPYTSTEAAIEDALRLARGMSYKAALAGLECGGGKAVLIRPAEIPDRDAYFEAFGRFVDSLGGRYITAVDSGTSTADMDIIARRTRHVLSASRARGGSGDPSPFTARGVRLGIEVAVRQVFGRIDLHDIHVAIQGAGHVGYALASELNAAGARLSVSDTRAELAQRCHEEFGATLVSPERLYELPCDVFAPCALGAVINDASVERLVTRIVAGAANNQLETPRHGERLHRRGVLYVPDYVINAGGLIHVLLDDPAQREARLAAVNATLSKLLERARSSGVPPFRLADQWAQRLLQPDPRSESRGTACQRTRDPVLGSEETGT